MSNDRKSQLSRKLLNLIMIVPTLFSVVARVMCLLEYEAHLAGRSLIKLVFLLMVTITLLISVWFCVLAMLFLYFTACHLSWLLSLFLIFILNMLLLVIVGLTISKVKATLAFPATFQLIKAKLDK